ncbi:MAG: hypothetical protein KC462_01140, partial [Cyanobacteria bacterium HKST-UBA05]|nr:hypothetical protein [Cyanobacteria bacterium HKST-UBA05]
PPVTTTGPVVSQPPIATTGPHIWTLPVVGGTPPGPVYSGSSYDYSHSMDDFSTPDVYTTYDSHDSFGSYGYPVAPTPAPTPTTGSPPYNPYDPNDYLDGLDGPLTVGSGLGFGRPRGSGGGIFGIF